MGKLKLSSHDTCMVVFKLDFPGSTPPPPLYINHILIRISFISYIHKILSTQKLLITEN